MPAWMKDYEVTETKDTLTHFVLFTDCDPTIFKSVVKEAKERNAMNDEIDVIEKNDRGYVNSSISNPHVQTSKFQIYMKPPADEGMIVTPKKQARIQKETIESRTFRMKSQGIPQKKKGGNVISLAEAAKGYVVFQQGKPCFCQARSHKLVSNRLSYGKIVCEQEGEGPCSFYGALVLTEGSTYAGLGAPAVPHSEAEAATKAYVKDDFEKG